MKQVVPNYRTRLIDAHLATLLTELPAVLLTGARATGKTTSAARHAAEVVRLDEPGRAAAFRADPDAALRRARRPLLLDEWQEVPAVLGAVKRAVDARSEPGQFLLTGSVRAPLQHETWAGTGRVVRLPLHGLTRRELAGADLRRRPFLERLGTSGIDDLAVPAEPPAIDDYVQMMLEGGFPELVGHDRTDRYRRIWSRSYLDDLVTRDAAALGSAKDPVKLRTYLTALALSTAGTPADVTLAQAAGINVRTAQAYDQLLQDLFVAESIPAWPTTANRFAAMTSAPKRYVVDTALAASAASLDAGHILDSSDLLGRFFDSFALSQLRPEAALREPAGRLFHLRTQGGRQEVDLIADLGRGRIVALEVKAAAVVDRSDARHLLALRDALGELFLAGAVLHSGPGLFTLDDRVHAVPLCALWT